MSLQDQYLQLQMTNDELEETIFMLSEQIASLEKKLSITMNIESNTNNQPEVVQQIPGSQYVLLPGDRVARLLTPTMRPKGVVYNLQIAKKYTRLSLDAIKARIAGEPHPDEQE